MVEDRAGAGGRSAVVFVRHGESGWNRAGRLQGQAAEAPGLTARGMVQARQVAASLVGAGARLVITSDLRRARETASVIASMLGVPLTYDRRLRERAMGVVEGRPAASVPPELLGIAGGVVHDVRCAPAGGETLEAMARRVRQFVADLRSRVRGTIVVVTHGGVMRVARWQAGGGELEGMPWTGVANGTTWTLTWLWPAGRWEVEGGTGAAPRPAIGR